jgi:hypothetical protein
MTCPQRTEYTVDGDSGMTTERDDWTYTLGLPPGLDMRRRIIGGAGHLIMSK